MSTKQSPNSTLIFFSGFAAAFAAVWTVDWLCFLAAKKNAIEAINAAVEAAKQADIAANGEVVGKRSATAVDLQNHSGTVH